jgi:hypothetical protein
MNKVHYRTHSNDTDSLCGRSKISLTDNTRKVTCLSCQYLISLHNITETPVKMVRRVNLMNRMTYLEPEDTPNYLSPSSETYWSM